MKTDISNEPKLYDSFVKAILDGDTSIRIFPSLDLNALRMLPFAEARRRLEKMLLTADEDTE